MVEDVAESCDHTQQLLALPFAGAATLRVSRGIALGVSGCAQQARQLFVFVRDNLGQRRTQMLDDRAHGLRRGERVGFALPASCSFQSLIMKPKANELH